MSAVHHGWVFPQKPHKKLGLKEGFKAFAVKAPKSYFRFLSPLHENAVFCTVKITP
jgi:hypothetical protein